MATPTVYAVILAGGSGTRFWPASRRATQTTSAARRRCGDEPLIAATVRRIAPLVPAERVWIATGRALVDATARGLAGTCRGPIFWPSLSPRNTAPCIGLAGGDDRPTQSRGAVVVVLPADHFISDEAAFRDVLGRAIATAEAGWLTTVGIVPTRPETGYGYIEVGEAIGASAHKVARFVEKPNRETAERFVASGRYLWNAGMFFFRARVMADAIAEHLPALAEGLGRIEAAAARVTKRRRSKRFFQRCPPISIDHGVMEKVGALAVVKGELRMERRRELGERPGRWLRATPRQRASRRDHRDRSGPKPRARLDGRRTPTSAWALVGVHDLVIVETDDAVLVIPRERAQDVRLVVDALKARGDKGRL